MKNHTVRIEKIIHGGYGLARLTNGPVVLSRYVLPGEEVEIAEKESKRGYIEAEPVRILQPSENRIAPVCKYYKKCGGCDLQHMNLEAQHQAKLNIIQESLVRAGVIFDEKILHSVIPSPQSLHYRYRIRLQLSPKGEIGFFRVGSHSIVPVEYCHVATKMLNKALSELRESGLIKNLSAKAKEIELLHSPADNKIFCVIKLHRGKYLQKEEVSAFTSSLKTIKDIAVQKEKDVVSITSKRAENLLCQNFDESLCGHPFSLKWSPGCFSQINADQNTRLIQLACQLAGEDSQSIVDLFCGMGNFSIPLALQGATVTGIERHSESIAQARNNGANNGLEAIRFLDQDVHKWIRKAAKRGTEYDMILVDPPRQGIGKESMLLAELSPKKIIYISCDPATLARDLGLLINTGFKLSSITPVDMFPQTHHIESVALLEMI